MVVHPHAVETACFGGLAGVTDISPPRAEPVEEHVDVHDRT
jgi:hypothetical protein